MIKSITIRIYFIIFSITSTAWSIGPFDVHTCMGYLWHVENLPAWEYCEFSTLLHYIIVVLNYIIGVWFQEQGTDLTMIAGYLFLDGLLNWLQNVIAFSILHLGNIGRLCNIEAIES